MPAVMKKKTKATTQTALIKVRPSTRSKFERVRQIKRWTFVDIADLAVDALIDTDDQLQPLRSR